ncbi:unnamed protein product [Symbiodinium natans]|uniref:Uncharacterized protein n=1 Tax=Symbiodinium natans TaxID=878477 RepID=A0A812TWA9_9DINO|nr:unnamed protein product [Symbiodinium natans]
MSFLQTGHTPQMQSHCKWRWSNIVQVDLLETRVVRLHTDNHVLSSILKGEPELYILTPKGWHRAEQHLALPPLPQGFADSLIESPFDNCAVQGDLRMKMQEQETQHGGCFPHTSNRPSLDHQRPQRVASTFKSHGAEVNDAVGLPLSLLQAVGQQLDSLSAASEPRASVYR